MFTKGLILSGRYKLVRLIGYGGMGEVWEAEDKQLSRDVALKIVHPHLVKSDPNSLKVLIDEACLGARLIGHPNIVTTLDFISDEIESENINCLVMENVSGISLQKWINDYPKKLDSNTYHHISLLIAFRVCDAIHYAHQNKVQHRDIKPLNIFISKSGSIRVGDFGISRFVDNVTRTHTVWNAMSPAYAAPEQWYGKKPTKYTDVYQLGCTLFQLFAKKLPFDNYSGPSLMHAHLNEEPPIAKNMEPLISDSLSSAINDSMKKKQADRIELWSLRDTLAKEVIHRFKIKLDTSKSSKSTKSIISKITEFEEDGLDSGDFNYIYEDFDEALSEALALAMNGFVQFTIQPVKS